MAITRSNIAHRLLPIALLFAASVPYGVCFSMNRFATEDGIPFLPYVFLYTVFGTVVAGFDVLDQIVQGDRIRRIFR